MKIPIQITHEGYSPVYFIDTDMSFGDVIRLIVGREKEQGREIKNILSVSIQFVEQSNPLIILGHAT